MGLDKLLVVLDAPGARYRPGDVVSGRVIVGVHTEKKIREIFVELKGESEVSWSQSRRRSNSRRGRRRYKASETYVESRLSLLGGAGQELLVPAGEHVYHFRFQSPLPSEIPPSFQGDHGHVRYRVKAKVDRPWRVDDAVVADLVVVTDVDLNLQPALRLAARRSKEKTLCCCWCRSGPLSLLVQTPSTGFVPGQSVSVTVEVDNDTNRRVDVVRFSLKKKVQFEARIPSRRVKKTEAEMASVELGSVEPFKSATLPGVLTLPLDLQPSGLPHCNIIQVSYCLSVKAEVSGLHVSPTVEIPVVVGTVPLTDLATTFPAVTQPSAPPEPWEAPPPSYEESVYGAAKQQTNYPPPPETKDEHFA